MTKNALLIILSLVVLIGAGCKRAQKEVPASMLTGSVTIAADEALQPLMNAEIDVFQSIYSYSKVQCNFVSEDDAVNQLLQEKIRLALVARPFNQKEIDFFRGKNIIPESIPIAYDAIAVVGNKALKTDVLSTAQLGQILSGEIVNWNQIQNSGMTGQIRLIFDAGSSGIIRSLNDSLHLNKRISGDISFAGSSGNVAEKVAADVNALGFMGYNHLSESESLQVQQRLNSLNLIAVSRSAEPDSANSFRPWVGSLFNFRYPLIRRVYALYTDPSASLARGFLAHLTSERGQKIIYRMGLKPESDFQREVNVKANFRN